MESYEEFTDLATSNKKEEIEMEHEKVEKESVEDLLNEGTQTISLTFGDAGENHVGMEMIGNRGEEGSGFSVDEVGRLCDEFGGEHVVFRNPHSGEAEASIGIFRNFVGARDRLEMFTEMTSFDWDDKYFDTRRKRVLNKHARTNVMFIDGVSQEPDYENKQGRIVDSQQLPVFYEFKSKMFERFSSCIGESKMGGFICEGNNYFDNTKCGIGFHGDAERRKVIALRLGGAMDMKWQWFHQSMPVGEPYEFRFAGGDLYVMSEKAVGADWRSKSKYTLRHAAGCEKYTARKK